MERQPFCYAPFVGLYVSPTGNSPCCEYNPEPGMFGDANIAWNSEAFRMFRKIHYNRDIARLPEGCLNCVKNPTSHRWNYLDGYLSKDAKRTFDENIHRYDPDTGAISGKPIMHLAIGLSNACNFACRTCGSGNSNTYHRKYKTIVTEPALPKKPCAKDKYIIDIDTNYEKLIEEAKNTLRTVVIHGGDPVQAPGIEKLIEALLPLKNQISVEFLSNGSVTKTLAGNCIFELLSPFKKLCFIVSVDGVKEVNEHIRVGAKHEKIIECIKAAKAALPHANINAHCTLSNLSVVRSHELIENLAEETGDALDSISINAVTTPEIYRPSNLSREEKELALNNLNAAIEQLLIDGRNLEADLCRVIKRTLFAFKFEEREWLEFLRAQEAMNG